MILYCSFSLYDKTIDEMILSDVYNVVDVFQYHLPNFNTWINIRRIYII